tara:strand:- start:109 stop:342 length:234 start_codon:yes stop_codon:yes gene_type:complete
MDLKTKKGDDGLLAYEQKGVNTLEELNDGSEIIFTKKGLDRKTFKFIRKGVDIEVSRDDSLKANINFDELKTLTKTS